MNEIEILKEVNKNAKVGMEGIDLTIEKAVDSNLKNALYDQKDEYENIYNRTSALLHNLNENNIYVPPFQKAMAWMGIQMSTLPNSSNSKLAEILIQGNDMGITNGTKLLNNMNFKNPEIENVLKDFITLQQENIDGLKKFL